MNWLILDFIRNQRFYLYLYAHKAIQRRMYGEMCLSSSAVEQLSIVEMAYSFMFNKNASGSTSVGIHYQNTHSHTRTCDVLYNLFGVFFFSPFFGISIDQIWINRWISFAEHQFPFVSQSKTTHRSKYTAIKHNSSFPNRRWR